jgi:hypothetical protein
MGCRSTTLEHHHSRPIAPRFAASRVLSLFGARRSTWSAGMALGAAEGFVADYPRGVATARLVGSLPSRRRDSSPSSATARRRASAASVRRRHAPAGMGPPGGQSRRATSPAIGSAGAATGRATRYFLFNLTPAECEAPQAKPRRPSETVRRIGADPSVAWPKSCLQDRGSSSWSCRPNCGFHGFSPPALPR